MNDDNFRNRPAPVDTLTLLAARSVSMTMSVGWTPRP
jgi:hypothetical protein